MQHFSQQYVHVQAVTTIPLQQLLQLHHASKNRLCYSQEETDAKIEYVLVEYQQLLLVLIWGYHGVDDGGVGCHSHHSDYHDSWNLTRNHWNFQSFHVVTISLGNFMKSLNFIGFHVITEFMHQLFQENTACYLSTFDLKHLQRFIWHFSAPLQLHLTKPCPPAVDWATTAVRNDTWFSWSTSSIQLQLQLMG